MLGLSTLRLWGALRFQQPGSVFSNECLGRKVGVRKTRTEMKGLVTSISVGFFNDPGSHATTLCALVAQRQRLLRSSLLHLAGTACRTADIQDKLLRGPDETGFSRHGSRIQSKEYAFSIMVHHGTNTVPFLLNPGYRKDPGSDSLGPHPGQAHVGLLHALG